MILADTSAHPRGTTPWVRELYRVAIAQDIGLHIEARWPNAEWSAVGAPFVFDDEHREYRVVAPNKDDPE